MNRPITAELRVQPPITRGKGERGFTLIEMMAVVAVLMVIMTMAIPLFTNVLRTYQLSGDARAIAGQISLASMRAANGFTRSRLHLITTSGGAYNGTYQLQLWNKTTSAFAVDGTGGEPPLSQGVTFSAGQASSAPPNSQTTVAETGDIVFNSRGIPVDPTTFAPVATDVIYISNKVGTYAIAVSPTGQINTWQYSSGAWVQR